MPAEVRRRVRRAECRADHVHDSDVRSLAEAFREVAVSIAALTDVVETGLADVAEAVRTKEGS